MNSMTGFGVASSHKNGMELSVSIKTVNGRYRDLRFHMPREYSEFESDLKNLVAEKLNRGTVDIYVSRRVQAGAAGVKIIADVAAAEKWLKSYRQLGRALKLSADVELKMVAGQPGVMQVSESEGVDNKEKAELMRLFLSALTACARERAREGVSLKKELLSQLKQLKAITGAMSSWQEQTRKILADRMNKRLAQVQKDLQMDPQRLAQEAAVLADKADIAEELTRLNEHIRSCSAVVGGTGVSGKKLDFYSQELLREVNTVGSKSQLSQLTQLVVDAKAIIERFREQVQNVE